MQYSVATFSFSFAAPWEEDVFVQSLFDMGFDTMDGAQAYIPTESLDEASLCALVDATSGVQLLGIEECADENWNAVWEQSHELISLPMGVEIVPHCAFGAGHHETTSMLIEALMATDLTSKRVLDNGCGTGVLGIMAAKRGAALVDAIDIDEKSVANTLENAARNAVSVHASLGSLERIPSLNDAPIYDLILSNIHRNILLSQMPLYARLGREVWLSGFYIADVPSLLACAAEHGLRLRAQFERNDWTMLQLVKA